MNRVMHVLGRFARAGDLPGEPDRRTRTATARVGSNTLLLPQRQSRSQSSYDGTLPEDVIRRLTSRLPLLAWIYASAFVIAGFFPSFLFHDSQVHIAASPLHWRSEEHT